MADLLPKRRQWPAHIPCHLFRSEERNPTLSFKRLACFVDDIEAHGQSLHFRAPVNHDISCVYLLCRALRSLPPLDAGLLFPSPSWHPWPESNRPQLRPTPAFTSREWFSTDGSPRADLLLSRGERIRRVLNKHHCGPTSLLSWDGINATKMLMNILSPSLQDPDLTSPFNKIEPALRCRYVWVSPTIYYTFTSASELHPPTPPSPPITSLLTPASQPRSHSKNSNSVNNDQSSRSDSTAPIHVVKAGPKS